MPDPETNQDMHSSAATPPTTEPVGATVPANVSPPLSHRRPATRSVRRIGWWGAVALATAGAGLVLGSVLLRVPADDRERFQGEWKLTDARQGPAEEEGVRVGVRITGERWQYIAGGREGKVYRLRLDPTTNPKSIELELIDPGGQNGEARREGEARRDGGAIRLRGVYEFEGDRRVRVRVRDVTEPAPRSLDDPDATDWILTKVRLQPVATPD